MIIPKDELTNFQRWQVSSFDKKPAVVDVPATKPLPPPAAEVEVSPVTEPPLRLPTAEDIERLHEEARAQGYAAGQAEGRAAAEEAARQVAAEAATRFTGLLDNLQQALGELDQAVAEQLLALAIEIAAQVTRGHLAIREDALLPIVREAIASLPLHHAHLVLRLNPADAGNVRTLLGEELAHSATQIIDDATISPGGCMVLAGASEVDATIETRWKRVIEAIGAEPRAWQNN